MRLWYGLILASSVLAALSCRTGSKHQATGLDAVDAEGLAQYGQDPVRLALVQLGDQMPNPSITDLDNLAAVEPAEVIIDEDYSRSLRESLLGSAAYLRSLTATGKGIVRRDLYRLRAEQKPFLTTYLGRQVQFPFTLVAGASIEIGRLFEDRSAAEAAKPFRLSELPLSLEGIKKLPAATYINLPIKGSLAAQVSGNLLSEIHRHTRELGKHLSTSATGIYSQAGQGTLIAEGVFSLQVVRLDGDKVRVRVVRGEDIAINGQGSMSLNTTAKLAFVPMSKLQRIRDFKQLIDKGLKDNPLRSSLHSIKDRINKFKEVATSDIRGLMERIPEEFKGGEVEQLIELGQSQVDTAVTVAEQANTKLSNIEHLMFARVDAMYDKFDSLYKNKIEPGMENIRAFAERDHDLSATVMLSAGAAQKIRTIADYVFSMNDPVATAALQHALFSRTAWVGEAPSKMPNLKSSLLYDFATAEKIATSDQDQSEPRVRRMLTGLREVRESHLDFSFQALFMRAGIKENFRENSVEIKGPRGQSEAWYSRVWDLTQGFKLASFIEAEETYASGFLAPREAKGLEGSVYWFSWKGKFSARHKAPIQRSLEAAYAFLGPIAAQQGLAGLYGGEYPGQLTAEVQASFSPEFLKAFFDGKRASDELLWRAFGNLATNLNAAEFGIPFSDNNFEPDGIDSIPGAKAACEIVAAQWGRLYCSIFQEDFLAKLKALRGSGGATEKLAFFEHYYTSGFLFNRLGTKLLVRYLAEVAYLMDLGQSVAISVGMQNAQNAARDANPQWLMQRAKELQILDVVDVLDGARL